MKYMLVRLAVVFLLVVLTVSAFGASALLSRTSELILQGDRSFKATQTMPEAWTVLENQPWRFAFALLVPEEERRLRVALAEHDPVLLQTLLFSPNNRVASYAGLVLGKFVIDAAIVQQDPELVATALSLFIQAVSTDKDNEDAKYNLELLLTLLRNNPQFPLPVSGDGEGEDGGAGDDGEGESGAGRGPLGGGY